MRKLEILGNRKYHPAGCMNVFYASEKRKTSFYRPFNCAVFCSVENFRVNTGHCSVHYSVQCWSDKFVHFKGFICHFEPLNSHHRHPHINSHTKFVRNRPNRDGDRSGSSCPETPQINLPHNVATLHVEPSGRSLPDLSQLLLGRFRQNFVCEFIWGWGWRELKGSKWQTTCSAVRPIGGLAAVQCSVISWQWNPVQCKK